jgi:DCN1-like protein 1/2
MALRESTSSDASTSVRLHALAPSTPQIDAKGLTVTNQSWSLVAAKADVVVRGGKWFYEFKCTQSVSLRFGWCTPRHAVSTGSEFQLGELGADAFSFAWDGRASAYHANARPSSYGGSSSDVRAGDSFASAVDFDRGTISFWKGGKCLGVAFSAIVAAGGLSPVVYIERRGEVVFDFSASSALATGPDATLHCPLEYQPPAAELAKIEELYERYFSASQSLHTGRSGSIRDAITGDGTLQLAQDLGVEDVTDATLMIIAWKFASSKTWEFTRDEFIGALGVYHITDLATLKQRVAVWKRDLDEPHIFKDFYCFLFDYLKEDANKTVLLIDEASMVWTTLEMPRRWPLFARFTAFLAATGVKCVNRDAWRQMLEFARVYPKSIDNFDADGAWPLLFDEFVEYVQEH